MKKDLEKLDSSNDEHAKIEVPFKKIITYFKEEVHQDITAENIETILRCNSTTWENAKDILKKKTIHPEEIVILRRVFFQEKNLFAKLDEKRLTNILLDEKNEEKIKEQLDLKHKNRWKIRKFQHKDFLSSQRKFDLIIEKSTTNNKISEAIIIELKSENGEGGFEQLISYMYLLKQNPKYSDTIVRGLLISGVEEMSNHINLTILKNTQKSDLYIDWFLYELLNEMDNDINLRKPLTWSHLNHSRYKVRFRKQKESNLYETY